MEGRREEEGSRMRRGVLLEDEEGVEQSRAAEEGRIRQE